MTDFDTLKHSLNIQPHRTYITGYAGTGKSTLLANFIKSQPQDKDILVLTPTHKAKNVLEQKIKQNNVEFRTIHSLLKLIPTINENAKHINHLDRLSKTSIDKITDSIPQLVILDEAGMIHDEHLQLLIDLMSYKTYIPRELFLFLDPYQLTPVKGTQLIIPQDTKKLTLDEFKQIRNIHSEFNSYLQITYYPQLKTKYPQIKTKQQFDDLQLDIENDILEQLSWTHLNLTKQYRSQKHITDYYEQIIQLIKYETGEINFLPHKISLKPPKDLIITQEKALELTQKTESFRYLAYTNKEVGKFTQAYQEEFNTKYSPNNIQIGNFEVLDFKGLYKTVSSQEPLYNIRGLIAKEYRPYMIDIVKNSKHLFWARAKVVEPKGQVYNGYILVIKGYYTHFELTKKVNSKLIEFNTTQNFDEIQKKKFLSQKFYPVRNSLPFDYNIATTVHKAQGSEFETVVINYTDLKTLYRKNKLEFYRLLYVASSRAIKNLYFIEN